MLPGYLVGSMSSMYCLEAAAVFLLDQLSPHSIAHRRFKRLSRLLSYLSIQTRLSQPSNVLPLSYPSTSPLYYFFNERILSLYVLPPLHKLVRLAIDSHNKVCMYRYFTLQHNCLFLFTSPIGSEHYESEISLTRH